MAQSGLLQSTNLLVFNVRFTPESGHSENPRNQGFYLAVRGGGKMATVVIVVVLSTNFCSISSPINASNHSKSEKSLILQSKSMFDSPGNIP